jgi:hypothetical protein
MSNDSTRRWRCENCNRISAEGSWLRAPHPFTGVTDIFGCPVCRTAFADTTTMICDEPGCERDGDSGWPTGDTSDQWGGYRVTCGLHSQYRPKV